MSALPSDRGHLPTTATSEAVIERDGPRALVALKRRDALDVADALGLAGLLDRRPDLMGLTAMAERVGMEVAGC